MESAKRASEIHKKRTGRYYRITEETVINEQMYEEEDDNPRYRLTSHMQWPNTLLQQRAQAMMSIQMENRKLLGQAVNSTLQHNPHFNQAQFISPGMMQMPHSGYNFLMPSPQMDHNPQSPISYHHSPYATPNEQKGQNMHQRSATIAGFPRQGSQSAHNSPVETHQFDNRRMSLPPQNAAQQSSQFKLPQKSSPAMSQNGSYPTTPAVPQQASSPLHQSPAQTKLDFFSFDDPMSNAGLQSRRSMNNFMGPLTTTLPMDTQQLLDGGMWPGMSSASFGSAMQNMSGANTKQQPFYSYRPNSSSKSGKQQSTSVGLDQTLLATASDGNGGGVGNNSSSEKQASANTDTLRPNATEQGFDFGFEDDTSMFNFGSIDPFNPFSSQNSAQPTPPITEEWGSFFDHDMFNETHFGAAA